MISMERKFKSAILYLQSGNVAMSSRAMDVHVLAVYVYEPTARDVFRVEEAML